MNMIHWIVSHTNPKEMTLISVSGIEFDTLRVKEFQEMYHWPQLVITMEKPFIKPNRKENSRDILKSWVKEPAKFRTILSLVYKMKIPWKAYQYLVMFSWHLYGQERKNTFP